MLEPLYTADEMRAAEEGHDVDAMMERAARAVADEVVARFPDARRVAAVCGKGSNGGDGRIAVRMLRERGIDADETAEPADADVVVDALFGTGFRGAPRDDAAELIERVNAAG
ncbi:MAG TPA: NAD(P)H-hydrate epimerase, partial [Gaiellaceae bacterium]|nr:NAD(P)H-hydrate epimerase [Gaiellaceae bacterium]